jgi:hypothetical protein
MEHQLQATESGEISWKRGRYYGSATAKEGSERRFEELARSEDAIAALVTLD